MSVIVLKENCDLHICEWTIDLESHRDWMIHFDLSICDSFFNYVTNKCSIIEDTLSMNLFLYV